MEITCEEELVLSFAPRSLVVYGSWLLESLLIIGVIH